MPAAVISGVREDCYETLAWLCAIMAWPAELFAMVHPCHAVLRLF
jgi:hypothetical protein